MTAQEQKTINKLMVFVCPGPVYLEQPLEAALLHGLGGQDVGQLGVGVGHQQAGRHKLPDKLGDPSL